MEITPELITQYGMMNKISTGNSLVDVVLCILVPVLLRNALPFLQQHAMRLFWKPRPKKEVFLREITHTSKVSANVAPCHIAVRCVTTAWSTFACTVLA